MKSARKLKHKFISLVLIGLFLLCSIAVVLFFYINKNKNNSVEVNKTHLSSIVNQQRQQEEQPITKESSKKGWVTYVNSEYDFQIDIPTGSLLIQEDENYVRIQNYSFNDDTEGLGKEKYYLEIYINKIASIESYDPNSCQAELVNPTKVTLNGASGFKGSRKPGGGESAPIRYGLCIQKDSMVFNVIASESFDSLSQEIVNSFIFKN